MYESHIVHAYSRVGIIKNLLHTCLINGGHFFKILYKNSNVALAFFVMLEVSSVHCNFSLIVILAIHVIGHNDWGKLVGYTKEFTFIRVKRKLPYVGPFDKAVDFIS